MKRILLSTAMVVLSLSAAVQSWAATQGSEGTTSSGTSDISVIVPKLVKIIGIADLSQTYNGSAGGFDQNDNVCIYSNMDTGSGLYTVRITGSNNPKTTSPTAGFFVGNAGTDMELAYTVNWNDQSGTSGEAAVTSGSDLTTQNGFSNDPTCSGGNNANFHVQMTQAGLLGLRPATYSGRITILITPE